MKVLSKILFPALLSLPLLVPAQGTAEKVKVKVRISDDKEAEAKLRPVDMVRSGTNQVMMLRSGEFDVRAFGTMKSSLDLYDRTKLTYIRSLEPSTRTVDGGTVKLDALIRFGDRPVLLGHTLADASVTLHYQHVDPALTRQAKPFEPLVTWETKLKEKMPVVVSAGSAVRTPFHAAASIDSSYLLLASPEIRDKESKQAIYLLAVVDKQLNVKWQRVVNVNEKAKGSTIEDMEVDKAGNAYFVLRNQLDRKEAKETQAEHDLKVFVVNGDGVNEAMIKLPGDDYPVTAMLTDKGDGKVVCAGVYGTEDEKKSKVLGNFVALFESGSAQPADLAVIPFAGEGLAGESDEGDDSKAETKDKERMKNSTDVIGIFPREDGSFFLVNEVFYAYTATVSSATGGSSSQPRFVHGPIQVRCLEKDGTERWSTVFRRWTVTGTPLIGPVFCTEYNNDLHLILLDSEEMAERRKAGDKISSKHIKDPYSAVVSFDAKGGFKIKPVLKGEKDTDFIGGWSMVKVGPGEYFALGTEKLAGGRFRPVRIEFTKAVK